MESSESAERRRQDASISRLSRARSILIVAGEVSGDKHAAKLISELKRRDPRIKIYAAGGERMESAGAVLLHNLVGMAVLGSVEVLKNYMALRRIFYSLIAFVREKSPDAVVLVDYPGFNVRLAKRIHGLKPRPRVIYYISPQVWAWGKRRKWTISGNVDRMLAILPFEKEFYRDTGLRVDFVGHPMLDDFHLDRALKESGAGSAPRGGRETVALLPGSRWNEVRRHLPVMLRAAALMRRKSPRLEFILPRPPEAFRSFTARQLEKSGSSARVSDGDVYDVIGGADLVIVASGTATLETACLLKPMVIVYRVSWPTYFLGRMLVKLPYIGMVNVIAGRKIIPECIQNHAAPERIAGEALDYLANAEKYSGTVENLRRVRESVGAPGASARAAELVLDELKTVGAAT